MRYKLKSFIAITLLVAIISIDYIIFDSVLPFGIDLYPFRKGEVNSKTQSTKYCINERIGNKTFKILLWTRYLKCINSENRQINQQNCNFSNCIITKDHNDLNNSDVIVFHLRNLDPNIIPPYKLSHQKWVLYNLESMANIFDDKYRILKIYNRFDWTMGYRKDSDIYTPYGQIYECFNNNWKLKHNFENKTKDIVWFVSNCKTSSEREKYVKKLQQYIDVDIYGRCGQSEMYSKVKILESNEMIQKHYKFYLSFENSMCKDYVTEKLYKYIGLDIIPVVLGSADYKSLLPYNSYIDVLNFSSPQHLSSYLKEVGSDRNKYYSYFDWKKYFCSEERVNHYLCELCEKLNKEYVKSTKTIKRNLIEWWFSPGICKRISQFYDL